MFPGNRRKAFTLSYDDGVFQDIRFVGLLRKYGLKCTFNLNSGIQSPASHWTRGETNIYRMEPDGLKELYEGHEIACHGATHANLLNLTGEELLSEMEEDRKCLTARFGTRPVGMAYAGGTYNDSVADVLRTMGFAYGRTVQKSGSFDIPDDLLTYAPTCHHTDPELFSLAERFLALEPDTPQLFYVWGHTYEFDVNNDWDRLEDFFRLMSGHADIFYGTNREVFGV